ncbi:MAG TPA: hypothetical protein VHO06_11625 [Polyangia bacterium]|nr:hypothetical protein [Polyangia bacterium]
MARRLRAPLMLIGLIVAFARPADAQVPAAPAPAPATPPPVPAAPVPDESAAAPGAPKAPPVDLGEEIPLQRPADLSYGVAARLVWVSVPSWLLNAFTKNNVPLSSWGTGVQLFRRKGNFEIALAFNYQNMSPPSGNWLGSNNDPTTDASFLQFHNFALYGFDASFIWHAFFTNWFGMHYGAGIGVGILGGSIERTKNLSGCTAQNVGNPSLCTPGPNSTTAELTDVPAAVPIVNAVLGVDFRVPTLRGWEARIEGGFYDAFFLGGGVGYTF